MNKSLSKVIKEQKKVSFKTQYLSLMQQLSTSEQQAIREAIHAGYGPESKEEEEEDTPER